VKRIGLIINPVAGIGGRVGLKGSDGFEIQRQALELGAIPMASTRTKEAIQVLSEKTLEMEILSPPGEMGAALLREAGYKPHILGEIKAGQTTAADTIRVTQEMVENQVDLLVFAGGDGTARDIYIGAGENQPVVGIPAGVKIHSAVFATQPRTAGELIAAFIIETGFRLEQAEVIDLDEEAYRRGVISTRLYGYLTVPFHRRWVQNSKTPTPASEKAQMEAIAFDLVENMQPGCAYILGPGTTTRTLADCLGFAKTLAGVDVVTREKLVAVDVNEQQLLDLVETTSARIVVTPVGGQGFLFGRGNQPISPAVIRKVGRENIRVICTPGKLHSFAGNPLLVDTGDSDLDAQLSGHISITTGYREEAIYRIGN
jgi:predicted polyphosphate/ATP-dependent NAD kinase